MTAQVGPIFATQSRRPGSLALAINHSLVLAFSQILASFALGVSEVWKDVMVLVLRASLSEG